MIHITFKAMGTDVEAWCPDDRGQELRDWFEEVEQACSRFRLDSELSLINASSDHSVTLPSSWPRWFVPEIGLVS